MYYFPEIIEKAGTNYEPHHILLYLTELASAFNGFYADNKNGANNDKFSPYKLAVTKAFSNIMENGLSLLGINVLEKL
jgi:arginyl-tRNA synthetase